MAVSNSCKFDKKRWFNTEYIKIPINPLYFTICRKSYLDSIYRYKILISLNKICIIYFSAEGNGYAKMYNNLLIQFEESKILNNSLFNITMPLVYTHTL